MLISEIRPTAGLVAVAHYFIAFDHHFGIHFQNGLVVVVVPLQEYLGDDCQNNKGRQAEQDINKSRRLRPTHLTEIKHFYNSVTQI